MMVSFGAVRLSNEMSLLRSWTYLSQFLRVFLPTLKKHFIKQSHNFLSKID